MAICPSNRNASLMRVNLGIGLKRTYYRSVDDRESLAVGNPELYAYLLHFRSLGSERIERRIADSHLWSGDY